MQTGLITQDRPASASLPGVGITGVPCPTRLTAHFPLLFLRQGLAMWSWLYKLLHKPGWLPACGDPLEHWDSTGMNRDRPGNIL